MFYFSNFNHDQKELFTDFVSDFIVCDMTLDDFIKWLDIQKDKLYETTKTL